MVSEEKARLAAELEEKLGAESAMRHALEERVLAAELHALDVIHQVELKAEEEIRLQAAIAAKAKQEADEKAREEAERLQREAYEA